VAGIVEFHRHRTPDQRAFIVICRHRHTPERRVAIAAGTNPAARRPILHRCRPSIVPPAFAVLRCRRRAQTVQRNSLVPPRCSCPGARARDWAARGAPVAYAAT
jgi:hypothetical protein